MAGFVQKKRHEKVAALVEDIGDISIGWVEDSGQWAVGLTIKGSNTDIFWWYKEDQEHEANELYTELLNFKLDPASFKE